MTAETEWCAKRAPSSELLAAARRAAELIEDSHISVKLSREQRIIAMAKIIVAEVATCQPS